MSLATTSTVIEAHLGPTNTGKTHRALQRMLEHRSGMIGLPLRLLAREVYDRLTAKVGEQHVALLTGEEKRLPKRARYWVCTVESMPIDNRVDFVAVDEVQLSTHAQRGYVFTQRLLEQRGERETWFMGSDTMLPAVRQLVPTAVIKTHPRLSRLSFAGRTGLAGLPPRSAIIAFSMPQVYELAARLRHRKGGAALVVGALSPRTRNSQVAMFEAGEVDYLVATDAVGMGLNLNVDHVAFAGVRKFDGSRPRRLTAAELAQIAGRAGRHLRDGTFGLVDQVQLDPDTIFEMESHRFAPVKRVWWRNADLDFSSVDDLLISLNVRPRDPMLMPASGALDQEVLKLLANRPAIRRLARTPEMVALLWDACRLPDFSQLWVDHHASFVAEVFAQLADRGRLSDAWLHENVSRLEQAEGDLETLLMRMESIRTFNYIAHRDAWVDNPSAWQKRTAWAEDRLSDALHQQLVTRFVDRTARRWRRAPTRSGGRSKKKGLANGEVRGAAQRRMLSPAIGGAAIDPDHPFAALQALRAKPHVVLVAAENARLFGELLDAPPSDFSLNASGEVSHSLIPTPIARLIKGDDLLRPDVRLLDGTGLDGAGAGATKRLRRRMRAASRDVVADVLGCLDDREFAQPSAGLRGFLHQLRSGLGSLEATSEVERLYQSLERSERTALRKVGLRRVHKHFIVAPTFAPTGMILRGVLVAAFSQQPVPPDHGNSTIALQHDSKSRALLLGYHQVAIWFVRIDILDELRRLMKRRIESQQPHIPYDWEPWLGLSVDDIERILLDIGFSKTVDGLAIIKQSRRGSRRGRRSRPRGSGRGRPGNS